MEYKNVNHVSKKWRDLGHIGQLFTDNSCSIVGGGGGWTGAVEGRANLGSINASQIAQQNSSDIDVISNGPSLRTNGSNSAESHQSTAGGGGWLVQSEKI